MPGATRDHQARPEVIDASERRLNVRRESTDSPAAQVGSILAMQRSLGNQATVRLLRSGAAPSPSRVIRRKEGDQGRIEAFIAEHGHAHLLEGFTDDMEETAIIGRLIENFFGRTDFTYDFTSKSPFQGSGDCGTLVREFIQIARDCFEIEDIEAQSGDAGYFIPGGGRIIHSAPVTGNIDNGAHWYFETHTWAVWKGRPIDVLFGQLGIVGHQPGVVSEYAAGSVTYHAGDTTFYLKRDAESEFDRYTTDPTLMLRLG